MRCFIAVVFLCIIYSCTSTDTARYKKIVDDTDKILVVDRLQGDSSWISGSLRVNQIKNILKRNIKVVPSEKFVSDQTIELFARNRNFHAENFTMTFHMTYGIGMFLSNLPD
jgi:hypothetical protein